MITVINGTELFFERQGAGKPVVFLHGMMMDHHSWDFQWDYFSRHFEVVRYDARGYGRSALPDGRMYSHAEDLRKLIDKLKLPAPVLVGSSMGGQTALEYAIRYPDRLSVLVLVSPGIQGWVFSQEAKSYFYAIKSAYLADGIEGGKRAMLDSMFSRQPRLSPAARTVLEQMMSDYSGYHFGHDTTNKQLDPPMRNQLSLITVPALVLVGSQEFADFPAMVKIVGEEIPQAETVVMENCGHYAYLEDPSEFNRRVHDYLNRIM